MHTFARRLRAFADELYRAAGTEREARATSRLARHRLLTGIGGELHRLASLLENWSEP